MYLLLFNHALHLMLFYALVIEVGYRHWKPLLLLYDITLHKGHAKFHALFQPT